MIVLRKFRKLYRKGRGLLTRLTREAGSRPVKGLPPGLSFELLNEVCLSRTGHPLRKVLYKPLSQWKSTCSTYCLQLTPIRRRPWTLIYKEAIYGRDEAGVLEGLPQKPGLPEYQIYSRSQGPLASFLPEVYACNELIPGEHYQYLLEDLSTNYRENIQSEGILNAGKQLSALHTALAQWAAEIHPDALLRYDRAFSQGLLSYVKNTLDRYCQVVNSPTITHVCATWPEIAEVYNTIYRDFPGDLSPIHGDYNISNILFHQQDPRRIKILDWEWAGWGFPHADLVSLLNFAKPELEEKALEDFIACLPGRSRAEHRRIYQWCKLQRGLLDASFTARQWMGYPVLTRFNRRKFIDNALQRALLAYQALSG